ncbi:uncharacterized protein BROUX77_007249 [Berkeleyomyces rouxiae]|uniref:uncharacterized protein n=1 Tax=Berkeleyomyces rouxiae TaxID=2035830 RepID=UPI003B7FA219
MSNGIPFGLRPWPTESSNRSPKTVSDFIARANAQVAGGFKALSEESLMTKSQSRNETSSPQDKAEDVDMDASEDDEEEQDDEEKDPMAIKMEIMRKIDHAHNCAMITLDFVSLLLTKESPVQAGATLTPGLREMVGIGTLGSTKMVESNVSAERIQDDSQVSLGWTLMDIDKISAAAKKSAITLKREIFKESKYWESVISVSEGGWAVCRLPNERHTLGVKFGFTEANPQFRNSSLAPMRRADDGSARLDLGKLGGVSQRLLVSLEENNVIIGRSALPDPVPEDASLGAHVLEARNTIFAQELWHELLIESRHLLSYGVNRERSRIVYLTPTGRKVILELVNVNDVTRERGPLSHDETANTINTTLSLLLSYAHRQTEHLRSRPFPPYQTPKRNMGNHDLLRPIIARELYRKAFIECTQYVGAMVKTLRNAGFSESQFIVLASPHKVDEATHHMNKPQRMSLSQAYISALLQPLTFHIRLNLANNNRLLIIARTYLTPLTTTMYQVILMDHNANNPNYLADMFPASTQYPSFTDLRQMLCLTMACAVTKRCHETLDHEEKEVKPIIPPGPVVKSPESMTEELPLPTCWVRALDNISLHRPGMGGKSEMDVLVSATDVLGADEKHRPQLTVFAKYEVPSTVNSDGDAGVKSGSSTLVSGPGGITTAEADDWVSVSMSDPQSAAKAACNSVTFVWDHSGGSVSGGADMGIGTTAGGVLEACKKLVHLQL